ncbi:hypothetical protein KU6B_40140 [Mameliella alba]|nr:hypothetical protein KU6B_40140 [Mameliella alba]
MKQDPRLLLGKPVQERILAEVRGITNSAGRIGKLVSISIGDVPEVAVYVRNQARAAAAVDLPFDQEFWAARSRRKSARRESRK